MKKKLIVVAVLSSMAGFAVSNSNAAEIFNKDNNKIDLYGKVKGEYDFNGKHDHSDASYARIGVKGTTQVNEQVSGFGQWEYNIDASKPEGEQLNKTRLAFAGINFGNIGTIDYGRNYGVVYDIGSYTDNLSEFGGDSFQKSDNYMNSRSNGLLTYRTTDGWGFVDGLSFALQYQSANKNNRDWDKSNGDGFGTSLQYDLGDSGLTIGGAYSHSKVGNEDYTNGKNAEAWSVGAKYNENSLYLATIYSETRKMSPFNHGDYKTVLDKTENIEAMAAYTFDFGLTPNIGYVHTKSQYDNLKLATTNYVAIGATYNFNKNMSVDAGYKFNLLKNKVESYGLSTDNKFVAGVTYQF